MFSFTWAATLAAVLQCWCWIIFPHPSASFNRFSLLSLPSTVCVLHSLLTANAACALWWFSVLSHCNFKWQTFAPLSFPPTHSRSPSLSLSCCLFFMQNAKNYFHFPWNWFYKQQSQRAKLFAVAQVKNATVHRIGHAHRPHLPEAHSRRTTLLLIPSPSLSLSRAIFVCNAKVFNLAPT